VDKGFETKFKRGGGKMINKFFEANLSSSKLWRKWAREKFAFVFKKVLITPNSA
jgi:hypothetical protein